MLCQVKRAGQPYYIESIGLSVWSVEELLYFMQNNLYLLDSSIINDDLIRWFKDGLHMRRLSVTLSAVLHRQDSTVRDFVIPIFREIHYPDDKTIQNVDRALKEMAEMPEAVRLKKRGDSLFGHGRYLLAIETWHEAEAKREESGLGDQFTGILYHNIGCAYARLFQLEEMCASMEKSMKLLGTDESRLSWLYAVRLRDGEAGLAKTVLDAGIDGSVKDEIEQSVRALEVPGRPEDMDAALVDAVRTYHKNTGM